MRTLKIEVDAGKELCEKCMFLDITSWTRDITEGKCKLFKDEAGFLEVLPSTGVDESWLRCRQCLEADSEKASDQN